MVANQGERHWGIEEYLWLERTSEVKHEYVEGTVYALAGGTRGHSRIASNAVQLLEDALGDSPCRVFNSDMKIRISLTTMIRLPMRMTNSGTRSIAAESREIK